MIIKLGEEKLRSGEQLEILCVRAPEADIADQIKPFLGHKGSYYSGHVAAALADMCDELETRFYVGLIDGVMVANIMTCEARGVGVFGHVHTREDHRRKGICAHVMRNQMDDFKARSGNVLLLGTGYKSTAYNIYASFGFHDWQPHQPGLMRYDNPEFPAFETEHFSPGKVSALQAEWRHWPMVAMLGAVPSGVYLRSLQFGLWGAGLLEGPYCKFMHEKRDDSAGAVLEGDNGAVMAIATRIPDSRWQAKLDLLDIFSHRSVTAEQISEMIKTLGLPDKRIQCYADPRDHSKIGALEFAGFKRSAVLPSQFCEGDTWMDALLYSK